MHRFYKEKLKILYRKIRPIINVWDPIKHKHDDASYTAFFTRFSMTVHFILMIEHL